MTKYENKFVVPQAPKTYEVKYVDLREKEALTERERQIDELVAESYEAEWDSYRSINKPRRGGPVLDPEIRAAGRKVREEKEREKTSKNLCIEDDCQSSAKVGNFCEFHRRKIGEKAWLLKVSVDTTASIFVPGYNAAKTVVGAGSWIVGQASGSQSAKDFGANAVKDECASEALQLAGIAGARGIGVSPQVGFEVGGWASTGIGLIKSTNEWINHQEHWEIYSSSCPVCNS